MRKSERWEKQKRGLSRGHPLSYVSETCRANALGNARADQNRTRSPVVMSNGARG